MSILRKRGISKKNPYINDECEESDGAHSCAPSENEHEYNRGGTDDDVDDSASATSRHQVYVYSFMNFRALLRFSPPLCSATLNIEAPPLQGSVSPAPSSIDLQTGDGDVEAAPMAEVPQEMDPSYAVTHTIFQDPLLAKMGLYANLPLLECV